MKKLSLFALLPVLALVSSCGGNGNQIDELRMPLTVDYSRSIEGLVTMGNYDYVNPDISNSAFTKGGNDQSDTIMERAAILLNFNRSMSSEDVVAQMSVRGLRPATARELLTLGHTYPRLQRELTIIALGSQTAASAVLGLWEDDFGRREARLWDWSDGGLSGSWFLAFRD